MITKKEDLINTYIENDHGELRDLYLGACDNFGVPRDCVDIQAETIGVLDRGGVSAWFNLTPETTNTIRELTLSDLKPRTKVEHEKLDESNFNVWDLKPLLENGELYSKKSNGDYALYSANAPTYMLMHFNEYGVYRKVERPVDWFDDAVDYINSLDGEATDVDRNGGVKKLYIHAEMDEREAKDFARILLGQ